MNPVNTVLPRPDVPGLPEGRRLGAGVVQVSVGTQIPRTATVLAVPTRPGEDGAETVRALPEMGPEVIALPLLLARERSTGARGELVSMPLPATAPYERLLAFGLGPTGDEDLPGTLRKAGAALARRASDASTVTVDLRGVTTSASTLAALAEGVQLASYTFALVERASRVLAHVHLLVDDKGPDKLAEHQQALARGTTRCRASLAARDLVNAPAQDKSPQWLAERAADLLPRLAMRVRDESDLAEEGFGGILAVGQGSSRPPRLIEVSYDGSGYAADPDNVGHVVLIGKGITFDSGGLSLKRGDNLATMKFDMAGAAAVLGTLRAVVDLELGVRVTVLVATAENMPGGHAQRPGDVLTQFDGRTVEVLNTDAEGRLVLADALAYACEVLDADVIVDVATLTGAMPVALGSRHAGLFCSEERLAGQLERAARAAGESLWRMPLVADYRHALDSPVADLRNIGDPRRKLGGGSITAALFLQEFTQGRAWAHLDIAGPAWSGSDAEELTKGGTGYGVRLLTHWLENLAKH